MNYSEGIKHMKELNAKLGPGQKSSFAVGDLVINYPGRKDRDDYQLTINGIAPTHTDIVIEFYNAANTLNIPAIIVFLDDVYEHGLNAKSTLFPKAFIEKIYWITLQEEINYPQPLYKGRKLPFQRFYEGALAKVHPKINLALVNARTNNHGKSVPKLFPIKSYTIPSFYQ